MGGGVRVHVIMLIKVSLHMFVQFFCCCKIMLFAVLLSLIFVLSKVILNTNISNCIIIIKKFVKVTLCLMNNGFNPKTLISQS
jgi:hypothetical protein